MKNENWFIFMVFGKFKKYTIFSSINDQFHFKNSILNKILDACRKPVSISEQFLILESIANFWHNLNLRPRTNPMKAMTRRPSNKSYQNDRYQCNRDPIKTLCQVKLLELWKQCGQRTMRAVHIVWTIHFFLNRPWHLLITRPKNGTTNFGPVIKYINRRI